MVFQPPSWVPEISGEIPDSVPVGQFVLEQHNPNLVGETETAPFIDGITGQSYSVSELRQRVEWLAAGLASRLGWSPNAGSPWDKVVAIYTHNTIDFFVVCWAIHRLNGICLPLHPTSSEDEITSHLTKAKCRTIFAGQSLVMSCMEMTKDLSIPSSRVFTLALPEKYATHHREPIDHSQSLEQLVAQGSRLPSLPPLEWAPRQGKSQVAFLCSTSGTSGKQKLAMLTHYGLIANIMQWTAFEDLIHAGHSQFVTGSAPFTHTYGMLLGHLIAWRRGSFIVFPKFDIQLILQAVPLYKIERLYLVPPVLAALAMNPFLFDLHDLSSISSVLTSAAPLSRDLSEKLHQLRPTWKFLHGYGLTELCGFGACTSAHDVWAGSSGSLLPRCQMRLVAPNGKDITSYEEPGEVLFKSPNLIAGYLGDEQATKNTFDANGWLRTGDVGMMRRGPQGTEHLFIVDRLKDMIKVKGLQVVPADIENVLLKHGDVRDAAVVGVPDELAGERAMAFVVRSPAEMTEEQLDDLRDDLDEWVQDRLDESHWLHDRIVFVSEIPKSGNGKVLRRDLRAMVSGKQEVMPTRTFAVSPQTCIISAIFISILALGWVIS